MRLQARASGTEVTRKIRMLTVSSPAEFHYGNTSQFQLQLSSVSEKGRLMGFILQPLYLLKAQLRNFGQL